MDSIFVAVNGRQQGPYTADQLRQSVARGEFSRETSAWHAGLPEWIALGQMLGTGALPPPVVPASIMAEFTFTKDELRAIARSQNLLMWSILAGICSYFLVHAIPMIGLFVWLGAVVFEIVALYRLGRSLRMTAPWLYCIGLVIPFLGIIILLIVSGKATRVLKAYGVRVGLMGGKASDIAD